MSHEIVSAFVCRVSCVFFFFLQNVAKESLSFPTQQISTPQAADDAELTLRRSIAGTQTRQLWHAATQPSLDYTTSAGWKHAAIMQRLRHFA
uniref:Secreted protein n=1 Tax=Rhipicephalus zambeziensis TaxID=60191 RepID=A0A224YCY8_9ACAR